MQGRPSSYGSSIQPSAALLKHARLPLRNFEWHRHRRPVELLDGLVSDGYGPCSLINGLDDTHSFGVGRSLWPTGRVGQLCGVCEARNGNTEHSKDYLSLCAYKTFIAPAITTTRLTTHLVQGQFYSLPFTKLTTPNTLNSATSKPLNVKRIL